MKTEMPTHFAPVEPDLSRLPTIIDMTSECSELLPARKYHPRERDLEKVDCVVLQQSGMGHDPKTPGKIHTHFFITTDGSILQLQSLRRHLYTAYTLNPRCVAIMFSGNFPTSDGVAYRQGKYGISQLTKAQVRAGRFLLQQLNASLPGGLRDIFAMRNMSRTHINNPGPDVWFYIGQWAARELSLRRPGVINPRGLDLPDTWTKPRTLSQ